MSKPSRSNYRPWPKPPGAVNLFWGSSSSFDLAGYRVYRGNSSTELDSYVFTTVDSLHDTDVINEVTYWYSVQAVDMIGFGGGFTDTIAITPSANAAVDEADMPISFALHQNYPNPFNPTTTLST